MPTSDQNRTELIKSLRHELLKEHFEYDANGRKEFVYQARTDAKDGTLCLVTKFAYVDNTVRIHGRKEDESHWQAAWDI